MASTDRPSREHSSPTHDDALRALLKRLLHWEDAHVNLDTALAGIPANLRGTPPPGGLHSLWQLLDHLRRTQGDILDFCRNPAYREMKWPEDYWPASPEPPSPAAWDECIAAMACDRTELERMAVDTDVDLFATIPHGSGQTSLRELLLVADHTAYHVGQIVFVRRLLDIWPSP